MCSEDPTYELITILDSVRAFLLPPCAAEFARSALRRTEQIQETIDWMLSKGWRAPTGRQSHELAVIYRKACGWLESLQRVRTMPPATPRAPRPGEVRHGSEVLLNDGRRLRMGETVTMGSPVGRALAGSVAGETAYATLPDGTEVEMRIVSVL